MEFLLNVILFFKGKNFTVLREFEMGDSIIKEYRYNLKTFFTDVWPPKIGTGMPIKSVTRDEDGSDVTDMVLRFSGPKKNYVNPVSLFRKKKGFSVKFYGTGVRVTYGDTWDPYEGTATVTDIFGLKKTVHVQYKKKDDGARVSA
jgi:hypothetical protein